MNKKKVVLISRVIYPHQAPRPMRATELAKEFATQGYDVSLYGLLGEFNYQNFQEETGVKVKSLGRPLFAKQSSDDSHRYNVLDKVLSKLFHNLLEFPAIELMFMVNRVLKKETDIDLLITIAIPYPIHWGAALFRSRHPKKGRTFTWAADCGDPYMGNHFRKKPFYFKYVEKWFCRHTDYLTIPIEGARKGYYEEFHHKIKVIPQGFKFDNIDYQRLYKKNQIPTFIYAGAFYEGVRDPQPLLKHLSTLEQQDFKFVIYTKSKKLITPFKERLNERLIINDYIPRKELLLQMSQADFLVNFENNTGVQSPSKLIDYGLAGRPVLSINSNEELDIELINQFLNGNYSKALRINNIEQFNIKNVVKEFSKLTQ
ncbi:hypothetical protein [Xanthomarina gelatinilytica]|uniref:hypothetical protein n=1 Tax=Xanthomarina gelatinilytica TaxID=1137281 RepID=UPI003AA89440